MGGCKAIEATTTSLTSTGRHAFTCTDSSSSSTHFNWVYAGIIFAFRTPRTYKSTTRGSTTTDFPASSTTSATSPATASGSYAVILCWNWTTTNWSAATANGCTIQPTNESAQRCSSTTCSTTPIPKSRIADDTCSS